MKKVFVFFAVLFHLSGNSQLRSSNFCITYGFKYLIDTTISDNYSRSTPLVLYGDENEIIFTSKSNYINDSMTFAFLGEGGFSQFTDQESRQKALTDLDEFRKGSYSVSFYPFTVRNQPQKKISHLIYNNVFSVTVMSDEFKLDWFISEDRDSILHYEVVKAITVHGGRTYEAWFCPSIPINIGPYIFKGLPGLIFRVNDVDHKFVYEIKKIEGSAQRYFYPSMGDFISRTSRNEFVEKLHSEVKNSSQKVYQLIGESKSDEIERQLDQAKRNSRKWYLLMELF